MYTVYLVYANKLSQTFFTKTDNVVCADRSILALLSAYQDYLVTFKLMTSQMVQRAR